MNTDITQAYVMQLRVEHRKLHQLLRKIQSDWRPEHAAGEAPSQPPDILAGMRELRDELARHFADEEHGGCVEEAICLCPSLGQQAAHIQGEHPALLAELDQVMEQLQGSGSVPESTRAAALARFQQFAVHLHEHEAAENRVLQFAFGVSADPD